MLGGYNFVLAHQLFHQQLIKQINNPSKESLSLKKEHDMYSSD